MPILYIAPVAIGSGDGSSAANAAGLTDLPRLISAAGPGGEVRLLADQGAYAAPPEAISIVSGGNDGAPVTIRGVDAAGNPMAATFIGTRSPVFDPANPSGEEVFRLLDGADNLSFSHLAFENVGTAIRVGADIEHLTIEHMQAANVARFFEDIASGANVSATITGLIIRDVEVNGYSKGAIRVQYDSSDILIQDVRADSQFQDGDNFAIGLHLEGTVHDVLIERVAMRNALDTVNQYRNGDGFATERGTYDITMRDIITTGNSDGGLDLKTDNIVVDGAILSGNGRNIRVWGKDAKLSDIVSLDAGSPTPGGNREHVWLGVGATATITDGFFSDPGSPTVFNLAERDGRLNLQDIGLALDPSAILSKKGKGSVLTLSGERVPTATGSADDDLILGTMAADEIIALDGDDMVSGGSGNDRLFGGRGADKLVGGGGDDKIDGGAGADILVGGAGIDLLSYGSSAEGIRIDLGRLTASGGDASGDLFDGFENVEGSAFSDVLSGDSGANLLLGGDGDDALFGGDGEDRLAGGAGADVLDGGAGLDRADYSASVSAVTVDIAAGTANGGDASGDVLLSIEAILGSAHSDRLLGSGGFDILDGGAGDDWLDGRDGDDLLIGGAGSDWIVGGAGRDTADYSASIDAVRIDLGSGTGAGGDAEGDRLEGVESLVGSARDDVLAGDELNNWLMGGQGADILRGGAGLDTIEYSDSSVSVAVDLSTGLGFGGTAQGDLISEIENIVGSAFADLLIGDSAGNLLFGASGNDVLAGRGGADWIDGGAGRDLADYSASSTGVSVDLNSGAGQSGDAEGDVLAGIEDLRGSAFDDVLRGDGGDNRLVGGAGADLIDGGTGWDIADYSASPGGVSIDLDLAVQAGSDAAGDRLFNIETVLGSVHADTIFGSAAAELLEGGDGADVIDGRGGDDRLVGGGGADMLNGGEGIDTADFSANAVAVSIDLSTGSSSGGDADGDIFMSVERFIGSAFSDSFIGDAGSQILSGGAGADHLNGSDGFDTIDYRSSRESVTIDLATGVGRGGDAELDTIVNIEAILGSEFADALRGDASDNLLDGGEGDDILDGREGADRLIGGAGNDSYVVDDAGDVIVELVDSGNDIVRTTLSTYALGENVEILNYIGTETFIGLGNQLDNSIYGGALADILDGGEGDDKLVGGLGADIIRGGGGRDQIDYTKSSAVTINLQTNVNTGGEAEGDLLYGIEVLVGSNYADTMIGSDDLLSGETLYGRGGNDVLHGGAGDDVLDGGSGADLMAGGAGNDQYVVYESGDQVIELTGGGLDRVRTAATSYTLPENVEELVYTGTIAASLTGNALDNLIVGRGGADILRGGDGADTLRGAAGGDLLDGGAGQDSADYSGSLGGVQVNLRTGSTAGADALGDRLVSIENIRGGAFDDQLTGSSAANLLWGAEGKDSLFGDDGADSLYGGTGDDRLDGGKIADSLYGDDGDDWMLGGQQSDKLYGGAGNDQLIGDTEWISSLAAKDVLEGGEGNDLLIGDGNNFTSTGRGADDRLYGGDGDDILVGDGQWLAASASGGADTLDGGAGNDILYGDAISLARGVRGGADKLTGGSGNDRFVFSEGSGRDEITDFTRGGSEADLIDISAYGLSYDGLTFSTSSTGITVLLNDADSVFVRGVTSLDRSDFFFG